MPWSDEEASLTLSILSPFGGPNLGGRCRMGRVSLAPYESWLSSLWSQSSLSFAPQVKFADVAGCDGAKQELVARPQSVAETSEFDSINKEASVRKQLRQQRLCALQSHLTSRQRSAKLFGLLSFFFQWHDWRLVHAITSSRQHHTPASYISIASNSSICSNS